MHSFLCLCLIQTIEVDVPLIGTDLAIAKNLPDAGIAPDVFVKPSIEDTIKGVDTEIGVVQKLIKEKMINK